MATLDKMKLYLKRRPIIFGLIIIVIIGSVTGVYLLLNFESRLGYMLEENYIESDIICNGVYVPMITDNYVQVSACFSPIDEELKFRAIHSWPEVNNLLVTNNETNESIDEYWFSGCILMNIYGSFQQREEYQLKFEFDDNYEKVKTLYITFEYRIT